MSSTLLTILSLSISGSLMALIIFAFKPLIKHRLSKAFCYYIWIPVLLRLVLPIGSSINMMDTLFHCIPATSVAQNTVVPGVSEQPYEGSLFAGEGNTLQSDMIPTGSNLSNVRIGGKVPEVASTQKNNSSQWLSWIWLTGVAASLLWHSGTYFRFLSRLKRTLLLPDEADRIEFAELGAGNVQLKCSPETETPMLVGLIRPCIILPNAAYVKNGADAELRNILQHEITHYKRKDLVYKWFVMIITSFHWFNPFMHLVRREISRACELSCDEAVIANLSAVEKQSYGNTLIYMAAKKRAPWGIVATTLSDGKELLKERLMSIMKYRRKSFWSVAIALMLVLCLTGCGAAFGVVKDGQAEPSKTKSSVSAVGGVDRPTKTEISTAEEQGQEDSDMIPSLDLDGDGLEDKIVIENRSLERIFSEDESDSFTEELGGGAGTFSEDWGVRLTAELGNGRIVTHEIPGWWHLTGSYTADFDTDGKMDIALILGVGGSNFNATQVYVYRVKNGNFVEFDKNVIPNDTLDVGESQFESFGNIKLNGLNGEIRWVGGTVVSVANMPMLRLRQLVDYSPGENIATAYYMNLSWNGNGWYVESMELGEAYGEEFLYS